MCEEQNEITLSQIYNGLKQCEERLYKGIKDSRAELIQIIKDVELKLVNKAEVSETRIQELERENLLLKEKNEMLEKRQRRNNIVIYGINKVEYAQGNLLDFIVGKLEGLLGVNLKLEHINNCFVLNNGPDKVTTPILVEFVSYLQKEKIFKNISKLKGRRIYITDDLTINERKQSQQLRTHLKLAKQRGNNAYIKGKKLFVNGEAYGAKDLPELSAEVTSELASSQDCYRKPASDPSTPTTPINEVFKEPILTRNRLASFSQTSTLTANRERSKEKQSISSSQETIVGGPGTNQNAGQRSRTGSKSEKKK